MDRTTPAIQREDPHRIWQKYCGFFDLSVAEFMEIQEARLREEIVLVSGSLLGRRIMGGSRPNTMAEFRSTIPITTYSDYQPYLDEKQEDVLSEKPCWWAYTSAQSGQGKWAPYTQRAANRLYDTMIAALMLAAASRKGEVNVHQGCRTLFNVAPRPYLSGHLAFGMTQWFGMRLVPPSDIWEQMEFEERIEAGFKMALRTGVDVIGSMSSVLVKIGERMADRTNRAKLSLSMLHPQVLPRIAKAVVLSKMQKRPRLPRDLWSPKVLLCWGTDTSIYKEDISYYWGREPYEFYSRTELGAIALQAWNKRAMTFVPHNGFLEFIPEEEWLRSPDGRHDGLSTVLLSQVEAGKRYLPVVTNFYGMPFLRYLVGDIVHIVSLRDEEAGIDLPQMVYEGRVDDLIDIAGFTRLGERAVWQAIANTGVPYEDWAIRKEYNHREPILHLYIELRESRESEELRCLFHEQLKAQDSDYRDLDEMLNVQPLKVTLLSPGSFQRYYREKRAAGLDMGQLKPPHMNASDAVIEDLLRLSRGAAEGP